MLNFFPLLGSLINVCKFLHIDGNPVRAPKQTFTDARMQKLKPTKHRGKISTNHYATHDGSSGTNHNVDEAIAIARIAELYVFNTLTNAGLDVTRPNFGWDTRREADLRIDTAFGYIDVEVKSMLKQHAGMRGYVVQATRDGKTPWVNPLLLPNRRRRGGNEVFFCVKIDVSFKNGKKVYTCEPDVVFGTMGRHIVWSDPNDFGRLGLKMTIRNDLNTTNRTPILNLVHQDRVTIEDRPDIVHLRMPEEPFQLKLALAVKLRGMAKGRQRNIEYYHTTDPTHFFTFVDQRMYGREFPFTKQSVMTRNIRYRRVPRMVGPPTNPRCCPPAATDAATDDDGWIIPTKTASVSPTQNTIEKRGTPTRKTTMWDALNAPSA